MKVVGKILGTILGIIACVIISIGIVLFFSSLSLIWLMGILATIIFTLIDLLITVIKHFKI